MSGLATVAEDVARFDGLQAATRRHRRHHGCNAYTFEDGAGLLAIARADRATRILEFGTAIGYTACVLATATEETHVDTIEGDREHVALAREHIRDLGLEARVRVRLGDFFEVMGDLDGPYDLAFFDGLGPTVRLVGKLRNLLRPDGLLVCGNLAHAGTAERLPITAEFGQSRRWRFAGSIEAGSTPVFRKTDPGAPTPPAPNHQRRPA
ncbi:class I SAM-dependent methyltransferase [Aurantimonas endophytica]|uniref:Putative O-methyltransferase YrrM n=1 Tax=Aurantimonas endophytica TaxID=1522175 RepID=A0A7W6MRQ6_9HYPH|nr:putative O-methyltransferase YrrM [Aurantimonas endophytica]MCO6405969.1 methyltransferase domain-containing protein [Aurantimonas endophytica]